MQRNIRYWVIFLAIGLVGLLWIVQPAIANARKVTAAPALRANLSASLETTTTQPLTATSATTGTPDVTTTSAVTISPVVTTTPVVTPTTPVTPTSPVTSTAPVTPTPAVTSTTPVTQTPPVTTTPAITSAAPVTQTPPVTTTPAVTSTPSVVARPPASNCQQLIVNGDFEAQNGWRLPVTRYPGVYSTEHPFEGQRSLRLGLLEPDRNRFSFSTGYQLIRLPADAKTITLKALVWRGSTNASDRDAQYLIVDPQHGRPHRVFFGVSNTPHWEPIVYDATALKGQLVRVIFGAYNNGRGGKTVMYVDSVSLESCQ